MLWRVRTTLPDRPGALAVLAQHCGEAGVNILGLQIFPGIEAVTDELVLRTPEGWGLPELAELVEGSGGIAVSATPCTEAALGDQPTRYVQAARAILAQPASFPEVVADALRRRGRPASSGPCGPVQDVMDMTVGDVQVQVRRTAPLHRHRARPRRRAGRPRHRRARPRAGSARWPPRPAAASAAAPTPEYVVRRATRWPRVVDGHPGRPRPWSAPRREGEPGVRPVTLRVDPAWQRRGIGTRLLVDAARLAARLGRRRDRADHPRRQPGGAADGAGRRACAAGSGWPATAHRADPVRELKPLPA